MILDHRISMTAVPGSAPNIETNYQNAPDGLWPSGELGNPYFEVTLSWEWPSQSTWTHFNIVRSVNSPADRLEEGIRMFEEDIEKRSYPYLLWNRNPYYVDPQPPPGQWTFYTLFGLTEHRVWEPLDRAVTMAPANYGWSLRLPEFLPGAATNLAHGVNMPADQGSTVVQFLQAPAFHMDMAASYAEAEQYFWDPMRCPPSFLPHLAISYGYSYRDAIGLRQARAVLREVRRPLQGSVQSVAALAGAATGCETNATISNNLMLNVNDSSFESGNLEDTSWRPLDNTKIEIWKYVDRVGASDPVPKRATNVMMTYFLFIRAGTKIRCGVDDPVRQGIPIAYWKHVRMGCYAYVRNHQAGARISMGMEVYDHVGNFLGDVPVLDRELDSNWTWRASGDGAAPGDETGAALDIENAAYGVPWLEVTHDSCVDLIVVDDG